MKAKKLLAMILSLTMLLGLCTVGAKAETESRTLTLTVDSAGSATASTTFSIDASDSTEYEIADLKTVINDYAQDGDTIQLPEGTLYLYVGSGDPIRPHDTVTVKGAGEESTTLEYHSQNDTNGRSITVQPGADATFEDMTYTASAQPSGAFYVKHATLTLRNMTITGFTGAAVFVNAIDEAYNELNAASNTSKTLADADVYTSVAYAYNVNTSGNSSAADFHVYPASQSIDTLHADATQITKGFFYYDTECTFGETPSFKSTNGDTADNVKLGHKNAIANKLDDEGNIIESTDLLPGDTYENDFISPAAYKDELYGAGTRTYLPPVVQAGDKYFMTVQEAINGAASGVTVTSLKDDADAADLTVTGKTLTLDLAEDASTNALSIDASSDVTITSGSYGSLTVAEGGKLSVMGGTFTTDPNKYAAEGYIASKLADNKYVVGPVVVVDSAEDTTSATDAATGVTVTFETEENDKLSTAATGMDENTSLTLVIDKKDDLTGYAITEATVGEDMTVEDVIDISVKKTTVSSTGTTTEDVPMTEVTATVSYYFPDYNPNKVYKVYYFPEGGGAPVDMKATYNRNTQCFEFTINHNSEYGVASTEINAGNKTPSIDVVFLPTAKLNVYDIVVKATEEAKYINGFRSADLTFELTYVDVADKVTYVIDPVTGVTTLNDSEAASGRYEFNMDGVHYDRANGNAVKLGTVTFLGYGVIDFIVKTADTNIVNTTKLNDSIVEHYTPSGALSLTINNTGAGTTTASPTAKIDDLTLSPASQALTVNVMFPNDAANNVQAYQDMTMTISGGDLYEDIVIKLGTDASFTGKDYLKHDLTDSTYYSTAPITVAYNALGSYGATPTACNQYAISIPALLHNGIRYTVTVEGAGYRTMRYSLNMNGDKSVTFWNNVMDADTVIERNILPASDVTSTAVQVTYLAGDIVKDAQINIYDLSAVVSYFGTVNTTSAVSDYAKYDLNRDGKIDSIDVAYVLVSWGK